MIVIEGDIYRPIQDRDRLLEYRWLFHQACAKSEKSWWKVPENLKY